jgi:hypothetical protein
MKSTSKSKSINKKNRTGKSDKNEYQKKIENLKQMRMDHLYVYVPIDNTDLTSIKRHLCHGLLPSNNIKLN